MSTMEDAILPTLLSTIPATRSEHRQLVQLRSAIRDTLMRFRQDNGAHREDDMLLPTIQHISSGSKEGNVPIVSLDRAAKAGAEVMQRLFEGEARLVDALTRATARVEATHVATATENSELTALRARMDELSCLVRSGNAGLLKTAPGPSAPLGLMTTAAAAAAQEDTSPAATRFAEARVIAYEKTVQALNNELALLHENYAALSHARACDIETLKRHMTDAQRKHEDQITECDAVLNRISLELEQLIQENAQLRCKLQTIAQPE
ncbi:hypothetical protein Q4I28_007765 [Leishmania naiffi]|uniref:Uncharacterized protein n=1 Tax=Leishmania naiffi TaxID=5678 RepID=A0AAW3BB58_9TRYP